MLIFIQVFVIMIKLDQFKTVWITKENKMEQAKLNSKYSIEYYKMTKKEEEKREEKKD
jgi:hypothetical protein